MITRACRRSAAMIMMVPTSPGARNGRQSLKAARKIAMHARMKDLARTSAAHQPSLVQRTCRCQRAPGVLGVERKLLRRQRQPEQHRQEHPPDHPRRPTEERAKHVRVIERLDDVHSAASLAYCSGSGGVTSRARRRRPKVASTRRCVLTAMKYSASSTCCPAAQRASQSATMAPIMAARCTSCCSPADRSLPRSVDSVAISSRTECAAAVRASKASSVTSRILPRRVRVRLGARGGVSAPRPCRMLAASGGISAIAIGPYSRASCTRRRGRQNRPVKPPRGSHTLAEATTPRPISPTYPTNTAITCSLPI